MKEIEAIPQRERQPIVARIQIAQEMLTCGARKELQGILRSHD
jgi:hypothetical protein